MGAHVASEVIKLMIAKDVKVKGVKVLILGVTFKENCPDIRNTKVIDLYHALQSYGVKVNIFDSWADGKEVQEEYDISLVDNINSEKYSAIVLAVAHDTFKTIDIAKLQKRKSVIYDIKNFLEIKDKSL
jgi:UDP-N-acetyl-D-galactosamine dehydrogenase